MNAYNILKPRVDRRIQKRKTNVAEAKKNAELSNALRAGIARHYTFEKAREKGFDASKVDYEGLASYMLRVQEEGLSIRLSSRRPGTEFSRRKTVQEPLRPPAADLASGLDKRLTIDETLRTTEANIDDGRDLRAEKPKEDEDEWLKDLRSVVNQILRKQELTPEFQAWEELNLREAKRKEEIAKLRAPPKDEKRNFPQLPPEALNKVNEVLSPGNGVVVDKFNIAVQKKDIGTLRDGQWLNDEVINFYGNLIMERSKQNPEKYPKVHCFNTNFFTYLRERGYKSVQKWTRRFDLFSFDVVLIPVHWSMHWCFAAINFKKKRVEYYDSLHGSDQGCIELLRDYLQKESMDKKKKPFDFEGWEDYAPRNIPAQKNGYDCGVFTCTFAEYTSRDETFDFSQTHMKYLRTRMIYEIVTAKLLL